VQLKDKEEAIRKPLSGDWWILPKGIHLRVYYANVMGVHFSMSSPEGIISPSTIILRELFPPLVENGSLFMRGKPCEF